MVFASHPDRGKVMAFGGPNERTSNDLYEWTGTTWSLLPTTGRPPRAMSGLCDGVMYRTMAYDARRDKLVVFGSATYDWCNGVLSNFQPDLWEWDATNGWVQRFVQQGRIDLAAQLYFDSQRGVLTLVTGYPTLVRVLEWDGGSSWRSITPVNAVPSNADSLYPFGSYDEARGRFYVGLRFWNLGNNYRAYSYGTVAPAEFEPQHPGCAGTLGEPELRLTHNWTRAWLGRSLRVDLTNLPMSSGIVALGWSDQQHGATPLPLDLTPFGMPGCSARVAPDSVYFVAGSNQTAILSLPVPANPALLGGVFFQQGYAFDPAANPLGLTTSGSVRLTIGSL